MSKKTLLAAGTYPFAHLLGGAAALAGRALGKKAEEDTPADEDGPTNEDDVVDDEVEDVEDPENTGKKGKRAKGKKAEEGNDDEPAAHDGDDDEPSAEDDDADEPEGKKAATPYQRGYAAANKRARAIFASPAAGSRPDLAAQFAFETRMSSAEAIGMLTAAAAQPAGKRGCSLDDRMGNRSELRPGAGSGANGGKPSFGERAAAAAQKAGVR